jgi:hypothetical protein
MSDDVGGNSGSAANGASGPSAPPGASPSSQPTEPASEYGVVLFRSVHGALAAERVLLAAAIPHKLIPVPRHLSAECGFCVRFPWARHAAVSATLDEDRLGVTGIARL